MGKRKNIIRAGDRVRLKPEARGRLVVRVGYPKTTENYLPQALELLQPAYEAASLPLQKDGRAVWAVARDIGYDDHFGGRTRTLHFGEYTGWCDEFIVHEVVTRITGEKFDSYSHGGYSYYDGSYEYDFEPGGIANPQAHRIAIPRWAYSYGNDEESVQYRIEDQLKEYLGFLVGDLEKLTS